MDEHSSVNSIKAPEQCRTLDEAIEHCVLELERGETNPRELIARFPTWRSEISEFLENWGGMESYAAVVSDRPDLAIDESEFADGRFGDYELLEKIGVGGMGVIYKARQVSLDRIVALKMIQGHRKERERFYLEAEATASLVHPHIVSIYETGEYRSRLFFSMQLIEGCNLKQYLDQHTVSTQDAAKIIRTIAEAVQYAHQRGVLHRDLKPANVMMDADGQPHITDFGLAKQIERDTEITRTGTIIGTPGYMAPEQANGKVKNWTTATDVYGLGAILYALLTGNAPFTGDSSLEVLRRVVDEPPASPRLQEPSIDRDLETICLKCLEKKPELRYASPQLLAEDLSRFLNNEPVKARPVSASERAWRWCLRNPTVACLSVAVVALLIATSVASIFLAISERDSRLQSQANGRRESALNEDLSHALERATRERASLLTTNGLWQAANQNVGEALLWFSEAARLTAADSEDARSNLIQFQSWLHEHPMPVAAFLLDSQFCGEEAQSEIQFQPNGSNLLYRADRKVFVWDYVQNKHWYVSETFPQLATATWNPDGKSLVLGLDDGRIIQADVNTRQSQTLTQIGGGVSEMAFVNRGRWIAVATENRVLFVDAERGRLVEKQLIRDRNVRKLITNSDGTRLVVINFNRSSSVYSVDELEELFEFNCHYFAVRDRHRILWPRFVMNDRVLLARIEDAQAVTFDNTTGERLGSVPLATPTYSLAVASDGQSMVSGCFNFGQHYRFSDLRLGSLKTDDERQSPEPRLDCIAGLQYPHDNIVSATGVGRNGLVATAGRNSQVKIWKSQPLTGENRQFDVPEKAIPIFVLPHQTQIQRVEFSEDGTQLVTIQIDGLIRVWKMPEFDSNGYDFPVEPGGSLVKLVDRERWLTSGSSIWSGHMSNASIHRIDDGSFVEGNQGLSIHQVGHLLDSDVAPGGDQLATIHAGKRRSGLTFRKPNGEGGWLRLWSLPDCQLLHDPIPLPSEPRWVTYHPSENCLAVCTCMMQIVIVDTETFQIKSTWDKWTQANEQLFSPRNSVFPRNVINQQIAFCPDGSKLVAWSSRTPGLTVWDYPNGELSFPHIENQGRPVAGFAFSPDGKRIAIAGGSNPVAQVIDLTSGELVSPGIRHASEVNSVQFSPDGNLMVTACRDGHARVFDWKTGELLIKGMKHDAGLVDAAFTPDAKFVVTLGRDNQLRVWNADNGGLALKPFPVPAGSEDFVISEDSRYVIVAGGQIRVFDLGELKADPKLTLRRARKIGVILANKTFKDGTLATLSSAQWFSQWQSLERGD